MQGLSSLHRLKNKILISYFQGSLDYIAMIKEAVDIPILRKDFIVDEYQVYEAKAAGADAILLIAEALRPAQLMDLLILARELTLTSLIEVHDVDLLLQLRSLAGFPQAGYSLLGINNRDLRVFKTDIRTTVELASGIPDGYILVSESGIHTGEDARMLREAGADAILVGESLVTSEDIPAKIRELIGGQS